MLTPVQNVQRVLRDFERIAEFDFQRVGSLVPDRFQRYARIFHPAWRMEREGRVALSWAEMAQHSGTVPHGLMQWASISTTSMQGAKIEPPDEGTMPSAVLQPLCHILERHTTRNDGDCWLGVWPGFGGQCERGVPVTVTIETRYREWALFRAPLSMINRSFFAGWDQTANLIWSEDPCWWIHTEIDLNTTYIGGGERLIQEVLRSPVLESWPATPDDDISIFSDSVNYVGDRSTSATLQPTVPQGGTRQPQAWMGKQPWPNKESEGAGSTQYFAFTPRSR